jgi:hypothetical protein
MSGSHPPAREGRSRPVALLVHKASVPYVCSVVDFVRHQLALHLGRPPLYVECADVATAGVPAGSLVFLVGDGFPRYRRQPGCRYVFINFSLVRKMRWWKPISPAAARWIRAKRLALLTKRDLYDMVLDFHPDQTRLLKQELARAGVPVRTFLTGVAVDTRWVAATPLKSRRWDVCFTGSDSPRRARMRALLETRGITVSPGAAPGLHTVIGDCRVIANVHFAACDTLEAPRIVHAFTAGVCLVTEPCYGLAELAPASCYESAPYRRLPMAISELLGDTERIDEISRTAAEYIRTHHVVRARESWRALVHAALEL